MENGVSTDVRRNTFKMNLVLYNCMPQNLRIHLVSIGYNPFIIRSSMPGQTIACALGELTDYAETKLTASVLKSN